MSTLILRISKRKVPLLERLHLLYPLSRIGTPFRSGTVHPLLVAPASSPPAGADSFSGTHSPLAISACTYRKPARAGIHPNTSSADSSMFPQHRATPPSWPQQPALLPPLLRLHRQKNSDAARTHPDGIATSQAFSKARPYAFLPYLRSYRMLFVSSQLSTVPVSKPSCGSMMSAYISSSLSTASSASVS